jgi:hypothetical protein
MSFFRRSSVRTRDTERAMKGAKRRRSMEEVESLLERNKDMIERNVYEDTDYSVFDFKDDDRGAHDMDTTVNGAKDIEDAAEDTEQDSAKDTEDIEGAVVELEPDHVRLQQFEEYCERAQKDYKKMDANLEAAVELMHLMNQKGGSLLLYNALMKWHVKNLQADRAVSAPKLHKTLIDRYNMEGTKPHDIPVYLPFAKETLQIPCHDALAQTFDLLTDPRHAMEDYLFTNGDFSSAPPDEWEFVGDINTGDAYRSTYKELIEPEPFTSNGRQRVLCPYLFYIDATTTGKMNNMPIEILKFTIGLLNNKARTHCHSWRDLGYMPQTVKGKGAAEAVLKSSGHLDSQNYAKDKSYRRTKINEFGGEQPSFEHTDYNEATLPEIKAQDYHCILNAMLGSYKKMEDMNGFDFDMMTENGIKHYTFVPVIFFFKVDGPAGDKVTMHMQPKTMDIQNICRHCVVRTCDTDRPYLKPDPER